MKNQKGKLQLNPSKPSGRFSSSCKALFCCIFVTGAILNILLTTILLFGVQNYHKADPVKIYEVFESPKYSQTNQLLDNTRYLVLYGQPQSGILNFIEHEANLRAIEGKPVVLRELEQDTIKKHMKETKHFVEMYLGQVGRGHHSWFILLNDTETPSHEIESIQKKYPHDTIVLVSPKNLNIEGFLSHKFPVLKLKQLKDFMQKDLNLDKKQIQGILDLAASKQPSAVFQAYKNYQEAKVKAAQQAQRLKRQKQEEQQRIKEQQERKKLQEAEKKSTQDEQQDKAEEPKKKKAAKKEKSKPEKQKKTQTKQPKQEQVAEKQAPAKKSIKKTVKKADKSPKKKVEVSDQLEQQIEQNLKETIQTITTQSEIEPIVTEVSKKVKDGKSKKNKKVEKQPAQQVEIQKQVTEELKVQTLEPIVSTPEQVNEPKTPKQSKKSKAKSEKSKKKEEKVQEQQQVQSPKEKVVEEPKKAKKANKKPAKVQEPIIVEAEQVKEQIVNEVPQTVEVPVIEASVPVSEQVEPAVQIIV